MPMRGMPEHFRILSPLEKGEGGIKNSGGRWEKVNKVWKGRKVFGSEWRVRRRRRRMSLFCLSSFIIRRLGGEGKRVEKYVDKVFEIRAFLLC